MIHTTITANRTNELKNSNEKGIDRMRSVTAAVDSANALMEMIPVLSAISCIFFANLGVYSHNKSAKTYPHRTVR